jgi:hypothetical protein
VALNLTATAGFVCMLVYPSLTTTTLSLFACAPLPGDASGRSFLLADHDEDCSSAKNQAWAIGAGVPGVLFYVIGIPLTLFLLLWYRLVRQRAWNAPSTRQYVGWLYENYHDRHYYWAPLGLLVKTALAMAELLLVGAPRVRRIFAAVIVLLGALLAHMYTAPYRAPVLNKLAQSSVLVAIVTALLAQVLDDEGVGVAADGTVDPYSGPVMTGVLLNAAFFSVNVFLLARAWAVHARAVAGRLAVKFGIARTGQARAAHW